MVFSQGELCFSRSLSSSGEKKTDKSFYKMPVEKVCAGGSWKRGWD